MHKQHAVGNIFALTAGLQEEFGALTPKQMSAKMAILQQAVRRWLSQLQSSLNDASQFAKHTLTAEHLFTDTNLR